MAKNPNIVPVKLQEKNNHFSQLNYSPQKLVARVKRVETKLFIYEDIHTETFRLSPSDLYVHENH